MACQDDRAPGPRDAGLEGYYEARAPEYDATSYELARTDPAAAAGLRALERFVAELPSGRVLDVGCGTGWLTRLLEGRVVGIDPSESMLRLARERVPDAVLVRAAAPPLPFLERSFDLVFTSDVYGHIKSEAVRRSFVGEALRVADELVVVEQAWRPGLEHEMWEVRPLRDGTVHRVFKRYFRAAALAAELGGEIALDTPAFVAVRATAASASGVR
jgi:SAM-dependent methyltransferase